jgi:hypothetical protein
MGFGVRKRSSTSDIIIWLLRCSGNAQPFSRVLHQLEGLLKMALRRHSQHKKNTAE